MKKLNERYHKKEEEFKKKAMEFDEFLLTGSKVTPEPVIETTLGKIVLPIKNMPDKSPA